MTELRARALSGMPEVRPGDDLAALLAAARGGSFAPGEVLVVAHKVVSKAEGALRRLADVEVSARARELAAELGGKDPRQVQVVLDETTEVVRAGHGVLISRTRHGFVCANAGVDASNAARGRRRRHAAARPRRLGPGAARRAPRAPRRRRHRLLRARLAPRASATSPSAWPASLRSRTGAGAATPTAASCAPPGSPSPTRRRPPPTSSGRRTGACPRRSSPASRATSPSDDGPGAAALVRPRDEDLFR